MTPPDPRTAEERLRADFDEDHELQVWYDEEGVEACKTCGVGWPCSAVALVEVLAAEPVPVPLDVERLARAWATTEWVDEEIGVVGRGRFIDRLAREYDRLATPPEPENDA